MKCLNKSLPLVDDALKVVKSEPILAKILDNIGEDATLDKIVDSYHAMVDQSSFGKELNNKIQNFLESSGVQVNAVSEIKDAEGRKLDAIAKADLLNKVIDVVQDKASIDTLPEEASHFFVAMLGDNHPLLKEMMGKITGYDLYRDVVQQYKDQPEYRNPDRTINFDKLKKEAIAKVITEHIIRQSQDMDDQEKQNFLMRWWQKLWDVITKIFGNPEKTDAFQQAAGKILNSDTEGLQKNDLGDDVYYQLDDRLNKLRQDQTKLSLDNSIDNRTGQKRHVYYYDGKPVSKNVTTAKVDPYYRKIFGSDKRGERQREIDLLKAEYGDKIHATIENIIDSYVDPQTNTLRSEPVASRSPYVGTDFYKTLDSYVSELFSQMPAGTKFMREVKVYDPKQDMAGSIDLLMITPDGKANIYDWKSQEIGKDKTEINPIKEKAYRIQLQEYMDILRNVYGFNDFGKIRAIPIKTQFSYEGKDQARNIAGLNSIEMGPVDPSETPYGKDYLLPVTLKDEVNDDDQLSELMTKLNNQMEKLDKKRYKAKDRLAAQELIGRYRRAIRDLHLRQDIRKFIELGSFEVNRYLKKINEGSLTQRDAIESLDRLKLFSSTTYYFENYMTELRNMMNKEQNPQVKQMYQKIINDYNSLNSNADIAVKKMENAIKQLGNQISFDVAGIKNLLDPEKTIGNITALFEGLSNIPQKAFQTFHVILSRAQNKRDNLFNSYNDNLTKAKEGLEKWAKSRGISSDRMFDDILELDEKGNWTGNFLRKYNKEYYKRKSEAQRNQDISWLKKNTTFDQEQYKKELESYMEYMQSVQFDLDPQVNIELQKQAINNWILNHNVEASIGGGENIQAWTNPKNRFLKANDEWVTEKWKNMNRPENAPLKQAYDEFQKLLRNSEKLGMLDEFSPEFIPSIYKSKIDKLVFGGKIFGAEGVLEKLQVGSEDRYAPEIDPVTGKVINHIPVLFTKDIGIEKEDGTVDYSSKSKDLFKVFGVWAAQMASYEAMSEIEDAANILLHIEKGKKHLVTDTFNRVVRKNGKAEVAEGNDKNAQILEDFVNYYMYHQMSDQLSDIKFKFLGKEYSGKKAFRWASSFFTLKTLALNPISGASNFVGGTGNALFIASKKLFFTEKDWAKSMYLVTKKDAKTLALLHAADVLLEDTKNEKISKLSVSKITQAATLDKFYGIMRFSDKAVQFPVGAAMLMNHMVTEDGKIVDITKTVKKEMGYYENFYNLSKQEQTKMKNEIDQKVKDLKENKSIHAIAKIENDKIVIPGIDFESTEWADFRNKIKQVNKNILGNASQDDISRAKTTQIGMSAMMFRNWMPQLIKERFSGLQYNRDLDEYTIGKFRLFAGELFSRRAAGIAQSIINKTGTNVIAAAKERYQMEKAKAYEEGKEFEMSEGQFIDLYVGSIRSELRELATIIGVGSLLLMAKPGAGDDDDKKGEMKYVARAMNRFFNEFSFYYLPTSFTQLVSAPFPVVGLANEFISFANNAGKQFWGYTTGDQDLQKKSHPLKYAMRLMPVLKEGMLLRSAFDDDFRRDWDIKL